jgi:hypothetical protein
MEENCRQGAKSTGCPVARAVLDHVNEIKNLDLKQLSLEETDRAIQAQIQPIRHKIGQMVSAYTANRLDVPDNLGWVAERLCPKFKVAPGNHGYINEEYTFQPQLVMTTKIYKNIQNAAQQATDIINAVVQHRKDNLLTQYYIAVRNTLVALKKIHFISNGKRSRAKHMEWLEAEGVANVDEAWGDLQFRDRQTQSVFERVTCFPNGIDISDAGDVLIGDSHGNQFHVAVYDKDAQLVSQFICPNVKVSRCCGLKITMEGYIVTLAKNNHHVLVLNTLYVS